MHIHDRARHVRDSEIPEAPPQARPSPSRRSVLVATSFDDASDVALRRGHALAKALDLELVILHVVPPHSWTNLLFAVDRTHHDIGTHSLLLSALQTTRSWCREVLGPDAPQPSIILKRGRITTSILAAAHDVHASLIVLGEGADSESGAFGGANIAATLIHKARQAVLVARAERFSHEVVAATNLADPKYPALRQAARLGVRMGAHVTFVHNVEGTDHLTASILGFPAPSAPFPTEPDVDRQRQRLDELAQFIGTDITTVVAMKDRTADAILDVARARDADLVVVGARRRRGLSAFASVDTAVAVAKESRRSVLVVPLRDREQLPVA